MKKFFSGRIPGILITILLTVAVTLFMAILINTKLLPTKLLLLAGGIFLLFVFCVCLLTRDARRTGSMITGSVLTILVLSVLMVGTPYLTQAVNALSGMAGVNVEVADVGIYVKTDSPLQQLSELSDRNVGVMEILDRENTDKALAELQADVGTMHVAEYAGLGELVDGLLQEQTDAILLNNAYLDVLT